MEDSKPKPLTYDALKSVLKYTSLEKREEIDRRIPQLRRTNAIIPYQFRYLRFLPELHIEINDLIWDFKKVCNKRLRAPKKVKQCHSNKCARYLTQTFSNKKPTKPIILDKSPNDAFEALLKTFIRNGTTIKCLHAGHVPQYIFNQNPEHFKLKVSMMRIRLDTLEDFHKLLPYIDEKTLIYMDLGFNKNIAPILDVSLVKNCTKLKLSYPHVKITFPWDKLHLLRNNHLEISGSEVPNDNLLRFIVKWKEPGRPIGSTFILKIFDCSYTDKKLKTDVLMDLLTTHHGAVTSKMPDNLSIDRCVTMKMTNDNNLELVVYTAAETSILLSLTMKIMHAGATIMLDN